jgi:DNA-binding beta-propeller fold protein YncE
MSRVLGSGNFRYQVVEDWPKLPNDFILGDVAGAVVDSQQRIFCYTRGPNPIVVLDKAGCLLDSWGHGVFGGTHGIGIGIDDTIFCTDVRNNVIHQFTTKGELIRTIGSPSGRFSGLPFNKPSHLAVSPKSGDLFVTDGYGNSRVHRFSPEGQFIESWGSVGTGIGQFVIPHNIVIDKDDFLYIADRENHRVQIFDSGGKHQDTWPGIWRAAGLALGDQGMVYVAEMPPPVYILDAPGLGHAVNVFTKDGILVSRLGDDAIGERAGEFSAPHGIAVDNEGSLYVCEMPNFNMGDVWLEQANRSHIDASPIRTIVKLIRLDKAT